MSKKSKPNNQENFIEEELCFEDFYSLRPFTIYKMISTKISLVRTENSEFNKVNSLPIYIYNKGCYKNNLGMKQYVFMIGNKEEMIPIKSWIVRSKYFKFYRMENK